MTYSYSAPLSYGAPAPLTYEGIAPQEQYVVQQRPSSVPAALAGGFIGLATGSIIGANKNPYMKNGIPTDTFAKRANDKYMKKAPDAEKKVHEQCKTILKEIDKVKTTDELKTLMNNNPVAAKKIESAFGGKTVDEFLNGVTDANLSANKNVIKNEITATNGTRLQNMKNIISRCWDSEKKKFVKPDDVDKDLFKSIKKASGRVKSAFIAKYALIAAAIGGVTGFVAHKLITHKKSSQE